MIRTLKLAFLIVAVTRGLAQAGPITVPTSLAPGDSYRLAFVTSTTRTAFSADINDYNAFVDAIGDGVIASDWRAIASTLAVEARDNTDTNPSNAGVPIFLLNDTKLAVNNIDLWNGDIRVPFSVDELARPSTELLVWTGTTSSGRRAVGGFFLVGPPVVGRTDSQFLGRWVQATFSSPDSLRPFYALSGVLTVPQATPAVPEPGSWLLMTIGAVMLMGVGGLRRRKRASELS